MLSPFDGGECFMARNRRAGGSVGVGIGSESPPNASTGAKAAERKGLECVRRIAYPSFRCRGREWWLGLKGGGGGAGREKDFKNIAHLGLPPFLKKQKKTFFLRYNS